jgi:hypothetical protein
MNATWRVEMNGATLAVFLGNIRYLNHEYLVIM